MMTQIQDEQALLPCPFCGSTDIDVLSASDIEEINELGLPDEYTSSYAISWGAICSFSKGGCGSTSGYRPNKEETSALWNTRALPALIAAAKGMGYAVVPVEPTEAMVEAGFQSLCPGVDDETMCGDVYDAMLTASQKGTP